MDRSTRYEAGWSILAALDGQGAARVQESLADIAPDMGRFIVEFAYGDVYARPGLDLKSRQVATVAALAALGNAAPQLGFHIGAALNAGCSPEEVVDVLYLATVWAGFPAGLNGIAAAREVFRARGIEVRPPAASPGGTARERGLAALAATSKGSGQAVLESLNDIAPDMGRFILDFSYGEVIARTVLDPRHKEIAMIAAATATATRPQLKVHIKAGLNVGLDRTAIVETILQMAVYAGFPAALNGLSAAREAFAEAGAS